MACFSKLNSSGMSERTSVSVLERVQSAAYQLLARDQEDELKASQVLKILDDSSKLQKKIEIERINARPSQIQMVEETFAQGENQKEVLENFQKILQNANLSKRAYVQNLLVAIHNLCSSVYGIKQLQHLIAINKRSQSVMQLLQKIPDELRRQFYEEKKIEETQQAEQRQQKLLQKVEEQVTSHVELLNRKKEALKNQVEKSLVLEMEQRKQYKQTLQVQNEKRLMPASGQGSLFLEGQRRFQPRPQNINNRQLTENTKVKSELKIETIHIPAHYKHQKIAAIVLLCVTILLLKYHFAVK